MVRIKYYFKQSIWNSVMLFDIFLFMPGMALGNFGWIGIVYFVQL